MFFVELAGRILSPTTDEVRIRDREAFLGLDTDLCHQSSEVGKSVVLQGVLPFLRFDHLHHGKIDEVRR